MTVFGLIRSDYGKYRRYGGHFLSIVFFTQGFWASFQYRWAHALYVSLRPGPLRALLLFPMLCWQKIIEITTGISLPASAQIGPALYIGHFGGIILNADVAIGANCNLSQGVTVGVSGKGEHRGVPIIGDNVYIGPNSVVAGKISIGNDVLIGACSLVISSFPDRAVVSGVPAAVISEAGSKSYIG